MTVPESGLPRWARVAGRTLRVVAYLLVIVVAVADTLWPSTTIDGVVPASLLVVTDAAMLVFGVAGVCGVVAYRWRVEWVASSVLAPLLITRALPVWLSVGGTPTRLAAAAMMTVAAVLMALRALDLTVHHVKTRAGARATRRRRRKVALA